MPNYLEGQTFVLGEMTGPVPLSHGLFVSKATLTYTDTSVAELFTLPANADIVGITVDVKTAFNDSGTDVVDIGKSGTTSHFINDLSVTATGQTLTGFSNFGDVGSSEITVVGLYAGQTGDATAGSADVIITWYK
jgi:hypothetical protein